MVIILWMDELYIYISHYMCFDYEITFPGAMNTECDMKKRGFIMEDL